MTTTESVAPTAERVGQYQPAILVVDDNSANLLACRAILEPLGQPVVTAGSGEEALRHLLQHDFAVLVLDVQMPKMSGFELAALIKSHPRLAGVPIIFVTAISRDAGNVFTGYAHGAVDYLVKPIEPEILRAKVNVFVDLYRAQQTIRRQAQLLHEEEMRAIGRRNDERFRGLTESMPLPVWGVKPDGHVYACNRAWTEYSGLTAEQTDTIVSPPWMHELDVERARVRWAEGRRDRAAFDLECRLRRQRDDSFRWHLLRAVPERGDPSGRGFWIVAATDIEVQKTAENESARVLEREQRAREQAEAANRMKDEFLATVSHELRTPLNAILGWARMVRTGTLDGTGLSRAIETIERNARVQAKLINDILDISRIISGTLSLQVDRLDLQAVVSDAIEALRPAAEAKKIELAWERSRLDVSAIGDASRLQQVAWNLVSNAVKFAAKGGHVEVRLEREAEGIRLTVEDDGRGIRPEFLPHVFDRFRQEDATISREHDGLGLGLAIVKHLVELHGGHVDAESGGPGKGAKFTVRLPTDGCGAFDRAGDGAAVLRLPERRLRGDSPCLNGTTILFVDDQVEARELVSLVLGRHGATVVAVETAEQAMSALRLSVPHVLISDIGLPGEDGYALIRRIRGLAPSAGGNVPAIALTAYARPEDQRRAKHEGFQVHLAKPVEPDELVALVASFVRMRERSEGADGSRPASPLSF
jgi:PAS domain S-box-containing protein